MLCSCNYPHLTVLQCELTRIEGTLSPTISAVDTFLRLHTRICHMHPTEEGAAVSYARFEAAMDQSAH